MVQRIFCLYPILSFFSCSADCYPVGADFCLILMSTREEKQQTQSYFLLRWWQRLRLRYQWKGEADRGKGYADRFQLPGNKGGKYRSRGCQGTPRVGRLQEDHGNGENWFLNVELSSGVVVRKASPKRAKCWKVRRGKTDLKRKWRSGSPEIQCVR